MRTLPLLLALALVPAFAKVANLSGTWKVNVEKSVFPGPPPDSSIYTVKDSAAGLAINVVETRNGNRTVTDMKFDRSGKETVNRIGTLEGRTVLKDDGDVIHEQTVFTDDSGFRMNRKSTLSLSRDGKTMTLDSEVTGERGDFKYKFVMDKQ